MNAQKKPLLSIVIPVYNEAKGLQHFHESLLGVLRQSELLSDSEIIYCDDGSTDNSKEILGQLVHEHKNVRTIIFSRNFGKESALTAGITEARGQAIITLDGDEQHPVDLIPQFVAAWKKGAKVVIGVRGTTQTSALKRAESRLFHALFNRLSNQKLVHGSTDFRLIDQQVQTAFLSLGESNRMTRALIDWLGFERAYISFEPNKRHAGNATYSHLKLLQLAANSVVSLSLRPLYLLGYLGIFVTGGSFLLGLAVFVEQILMHDPLSWKFTGTAMLGILMLFFIGIVLLSQGILAIYISHIHTESKHRPLYIIDQESSLDNE